MLPGMTRNYFDCPPELWQLKKKYKRNLSNLQAWLNNMARWFVQQISFLLKIQAHPVPEMMWALGPFSHFFGVILVLVIHTWHLQRMDLSCANLACTQEDIEGNMRIGAVLPRAYFKSVEVRRAQSIYWLSVFLYHLSISYTIHQFYTF